MYASFSPFGGCHTATAYDRLLTEGRMDPFTTHASPSHQEYLDVSPRPRGLNQDRCHRIGQTKPVTVIKMVAQGTVDEDIYTTGERKKKVNKSVLNDAASKEPDATATISGTYRTASFWFC